MAKFNKVNISALAAEKGISYRSVDLLRQTTVKKIVEAFKGKEAAVVKSIILNNIKLLLNAMVVDKKPAKAVELFKGNKEERNNG